MIIKGEKKKEEKENGIHHHYIERYSGSFQRSLRLPVSVQADRVRTTFDKGILKIILPKAEEVKKKEIEVTVE